MGASLEDSSSDAAKSAASTMSLLHESEDSDTLRAVGPLLCVQIVVSGADRVVRVGIGVLLGEHTINSSSSLLASEFETTMVGVSLRAL